jgi:hypothetical protein
MIGGVTAYGLRGGVVPYFISNYDIVLNDEDNDCKSFSTPMTKILVLPEGDYSTTSLLGIDFLKNYTLKFEAESVILES